MAELTCAICLDELKAPVVTPCGHIHCKACLSKHIRSGADAIQSTCPTCRGEFHIVTPDLDFIPQKLHPFITSSVRRIYLPDDASNSMGPSPMKLLKQQMAQLEARNKDLERVAIIRSREISLLLDRCESHMVASRKNAERERSTRLENEKLKVKIHELRKRIDVVENKCSTFKAPSFLRAAQPGQAGKRKSSQAASDSFVSSDESFTQSEESRPMVHITKRPRLHTSALIKGSFNTPQASSKFRQGPNNVDCDFPSSDEDDIAQDSDASGVFA